MLFKKKQLEQHVEGPMLHELRKLTAELIAKANQAESTAETDRLVETTSVREVQTAKSLVSTQNELLKAVASAGARGVSVAAIKRDVIEPAIDKAVVGDIAWVMISTVLDSAAERERAVVQRTSVSI